MMGVYIKGMKMPKDGYIDIRLFSDGTATTQTGQNPFYKEFQVVEVSPHGRLIDADATRWIPVTERLPDEYVSVLCYCSRNGQYECGERCKEDNGTIYWIGLNGMIPTHWMPLPSAPTEE